MGPVDRAVIEQGQRQALTAILVDLAGGRAAYETDATFHSQVDMLVAGLPAMVRALAEEVPGRQARQQQMAGLAAREPITAEQAGKLLTDFAETMTEETSAQPPLRRCIPHGVPSCPTCFDPVE